MLNIGRDIPQTGLGERSHLLSRQITVDTHIQDVANVIETDELREGLSRGWGWRGSNQGNT